MADLKDILNENDDLRDDELLKYVQGSLPKDEQYKVEQKLNDSDFESDAIEGLQQLRNKESIGKYVEELNSNLRKQVAAKKHRKEKRRYKDNPWIVISVVIVLFLLVLAYVVISYYDKHPVSRDPEPSGQY